MLCSRCKKKEASVFRKKIVNNRVEEVRLCPDCAAALPAPAQSATSPIFDLLASFGKAYSPRVRRPRELRCAACGWKFSDLKKTSLLGCPECYRSFAEPLKEVLQQIHGATRHTGKAPTRVLQAQGKRELAESIARLRQQLEKAVATEDFEQAVRLRDRLRLLEGDLG